MGDYDDHLMDALQEEYYKEEILDRYRDDLIEEFQEERLSSYYKANPYIAKPALQFLGKAKELQSVDPTSSFILAFASSEYFLKKVMLEPLVAGLIHDEALDEVIAPIVMKDKGFVNLLLDIMRTHDIVLNEEAFGQTGRTIKQEWERQKEIRNSAVHRCSEVSSEDAFFAVSLSELFAGDILSRFASAFGLSITLRA